MNNNYNGYYDPYLYTRNIPNPNYVRTIPNNYGNLFNINQTRNAGGLLSRILPGLGGAGSALSSTPGIASSIASTGSSGITFSGILNGASKTLGVINQAIPVITQFKPVWNNAKTMLRMAKAINSNDYEITKKVVPTNTTSKTINDNNKIINNEMAFEKANNNEPTFFN